MSLIDYDELTCKICGHIGLLPDGDYNVECPACDATYSLIDDEGYESDDEYSGAYDEDDESDDENDGTYDESDESDDENNEAYDEDGEFDDECDDTDMDSDLEINMAREKYNAHENNVELDEEEEYDR